MSETTTQSGFEGWVILELMGHRRLFGHLSEQEIGGQSFLRIDVPHIEEGEGFAATQFYSAASVYCITPTTEEIARRGAASCQPRPVERWELPAPASRSDEMGDDDQF